MYMHFAGGRRMWVGWAAESAKRRKMCIFKKQICVMSFFFIVFLMIQLHFILQVFWKWYVLSHAARGGLFSFPTCVGCCFYS